MAKRGPQSVLNHDNWDNEDDTAEEAGIFKQATKSAMEQRVIKKAKRRGGDDGGTGAFGGFGGFGGIASKPALNQNTTAKTTNSTSFKLSTATADPVFKPKLFSGGAAATSPFGKVEKSSPAKSESKDNSTYLHGLKSLNEGVLAWIKQHVDKNPYIILTPIFKDYEKYLATLESKKSSSTTTTTNGSGSTESSKAAPLGTLGETTTKSVFASPLSKQQPEDDKEDAKKDEKEEEKEKSPKKASAAVFAFGSTSSDGDGFKFSSSSTPTTGFAFGKTSTTSAPSSTFTFGQSSATTATPGFSFGTTSTSATSIAPTAFGGAASFSFGTLAANSLAAAQASGSDNKGQEDDEYVPPKPEVKEIKEDGSLYSKRCKLFYQKDGQWAERGVGNVHIKPLEETKTQILIRADTNLGNILLNIMVTSGLPVSRQGKNNLLLVCVPNPPIKEGQEGDQKPISMLIRVKTGAEADELLTTLEERKALL